MRETERGRKTDYDNDTRKPTRKKRQNNVSETNFFERF